MTVTYWASSVADVVTEPELPVNAAVSGVDIVFADGRHAELTVRGRQLIEFALRSLSEGRVVHVEAEDELMVPERAAEILGVSRPTVYRWQDAGLLPRVEQGKVRAVPADAVMRLKATRDSRARAEALASEAASMAPASTVSREAAFEAVAAAVRRGSAADAAAVVRRRRATSVAEAAEAARRALAPAVEE